MALIACRLGARRVYAVEPSSAIQVAREIAESNGYSNTIVFIQNHSTQVSLPEPADVMVSDLRGVLPLFQNHIPSVIDARTRLLAEGGVLLPIGDKLWAVPVEAGELYEQFDRPWTRSLLGFDMHAARTYIRHAWCKGRFTPGQLLSDPVCWKTIDYRTIDNPSMRETLRFSVTRPGQVNGYGIWFDALLGDGLGFSNAPGQPESIYGSAFFPLTEPVAVEVGDVLDTVLMADLVNDTYLWRWHTRILSSGQPDQVKADFKQSTFYAYPLTLQQLHRQNAGFMPKLKPRGCVDARILALMDGKTSLKQIADRITGEFPEQFHTPRDAFHRVKQLAGKYGE
jgi:protein arginine N-methyltransferase 1